MDGRTYGQTDVRTNAIAMDFSRTRGSKNQKNQMQRSGEISKKTHLSRTRGSKNQKNQMQRSGEISKKTQFLRKFVETRVFGNIPYTLQKTPY